MSGAEEDRKDGAELRITAAPADLGRLYPWLDAAAKGGAVPGPLLHAMHVALEEAVANVAMHAFAPGEAGPIVVRLATGPDAATLVVEDAGRPFDPTAAAPSARPGSIAEAEPGGVGLRLIRHYCKDLRYERVGARNRLILRFTLPGT